MPADLDPDAELMLRVKRGDLRAFEDLVRKYQQPVINLVFRTLPDAKEAEDIAQNVFIQAYKSSDRYRATAKFSTWLFTIARNLCLNEIRRRTRHPSHSLDQQISDESGEVQQQFEDPKVQPPDGEALNDELHGKVEEAIRELPENQRVAILLCRHEDTSYDEIASVLGCSVSATKSLIHRARETLKQRLKPYLSTGSWKT